MPDRFTVGLLFAVVGGILGASQEGKWVIIAWLGLLGINFFLAAVLAVREEVWMKKEDIKKFICTILPMFLVAFFIIFDAKIMPKGQILTMAATFFLIAYELINFLRHLHLLYPHNKKLGAIIHRLD